MGSNFRRVELEADDLLFFIHIPKAAGTAFYDLLSSHYEPAQVGRWTDAELECAYHASTPLELGEVRLMRGHVDTTIRKILPRRTRFVTMLRNPLDRVVSHFSYLQRVYHPGHEAVQDMDLGQFLAYEPGNFFARNYDLRMIAGATYGGAMGSYDAPDLLDRAKRSLESFAYFGVAERYSDSIRLLDRTFGWPASRTQDARNVAPKRHEELPPRLWQQLVEANKFGLEFYQWARDLFDARYKSLCRSFGEADSTFESAYLSERYEQEIAQARRVFALNVQRFEAKRPVELSTGLSVTANQPHLVTVITPTHNHEEVISECIRSVLNQTYPHWEMVVVDDGSTDLTAHLVRRFRDPRIRCINQENKGITRLKETYNTALGSAKGEIVAILEGDDFWPEKKLETQVPDFEDPRVVLSSGFTAIYRDGVIEGQTPVNVPEAQFGLNRPVGRAALSMMQPDNLTFTFPVSTMLRTQTLRGIGGFQQPAYLPLVDFPTFLRISIEGEFRFHQTVLGYWRRHGLSVTQGNLSSILENAYRHAFEFLGEFRHRIPATDEELDELERSWDEVACMRCVLRGRLLAREGKGSLASRAFAEALAYRHSGRTAAIVAAARILAVVGLPVDAIYRRLSGVELDPAITLSTGDRTVSGADMERSRVVGRWRAQEPK